MAPFGLIFKKVSSSFITNILNICIFIGLVCFGDIDWWICHQLSGVFFIFKDVSYLLLFWSLFAVILLLSLLSPLLSSLLPLLSSFSFIFVFTSVIYFHHYLSLQYWYCYYHCYQFTLSSLLFFYSY